MIKQRIRNQERATKLMLRCSITFGIVLMLTQLDWSASLLAQDKKVLTAGNATAIQRSRVQTVPQNNKPRAAQTVSFQQNPGMYGTGPQREIGPTIRDYSWIYIEEPEPQQILQHDIITIIVDKKYQDRVDSQFDRSRTSTFKAELKEFLRITEDGNLGNAASNQPTIDSNLQGNFSAAGAVSNQEGIQYRIAAIVVEVLPNGNLVLEARDRIEINGDVYVYTLSGVLPSDKVAQNMTVSSDHIYGFDVSKSMKGKVGDSVKRPWGVWVMDKIFPF